MESRVLTDKKLMKLTRPLIACVLLVIGNQQLVAEEPGLSRLGQVAFLEGPAWRKDGVVFFTDVQNSRIMRRDTGGEIRVHREQSGGANGLYIDSNDNLLIAESVGRVVREFPSGDIEILADSFQGKAFNSPNDLAVDKQGRIYFTDPAYRNRANAPQRDSAGNVIDGVYRIDGPGDVVRILADEIGVPNGILVSPNDQYLYVTDNDSRANGVRQLWRFDLNSDGSVNKKSKKLMFDWGTDRGPDGMAIDSQGNIYAAAGLNTPLPNRTSLIHKGGIYVISPSGILIDFIAIPMDSVTNVTFGGQDLKTLFITAGHSLWRYPVNVPGYLPY